MPISVAEDRDAREPAHRDAEAVAAVLRGETVSYRELVERYQRLVYAVTWSRLGDAALAEDAAQEAFIRAYRSLPLLGNGSKFSAWVTTIARNTAISLGWKQRRELEKRERWALEQPASEPPAAIEEAACPPEVLRQALAELSAEHRESLVLFYLEGKRGAEVAAALGISEAAVRMRLLRARAALRERLEAHLGESLARLHPPHSLIPGVMGMVLSSSTTKAGGATAVGTALLGALGKVLPLKIALSFAPLVTLWGVAAVPLARRNIRRYEQNFRDPEGIHAQMFHKLAQKASWLELFWANVIDLIFLGLLWLAVKIIGDQICGAVLASIFLVLLVKLARQLPINRGRDVYSTIVLLAFLVLLLVMMVFDPRQTTFMSRLLVVYWTWAALNSIDRMRAGRTLMDSNLFVLEQLGLLPVAGESAAVDKVEERLSRAQLLAFARFLGERDMVDDYRWVRPGEELMLKAGPLSSSLLLAPVNFLLPALRWREWSWICLKADGAVSAHCSQEGIHQVTREAERQIADVGAMERRVEAAVEAAWSHFRAGDTVQAERAVGQMRVEEVFLKLPAPAWTRKGLLQAIALGVGIFFVGFVAVLVFLKLKH